MKTNKNIIIASVIVFVLAAGFAKSGWSQAATTAVKIKNKVGLGTYLVNSNEMTLYTLKNDSQGKSTCTGECAVMWAPFYSKSITVPSDLKKSDFGTITRDDGKQQTTYKGMPLYYFAGDEKAGDTNGNGVYNIWLPAALSKSK